MPVQAASDYNETHGEGFEGQKVDLQLTNITSKTVEEPSGIVFGRAVVRGTGDDQVLLPASDLDEFMGITELTSAGITDESGVHGYEYQKEANILDFGMIYVYTEQAVVPGDDVFFRHTANTAPLDTIGVFRKDADTDKAKQIPGATFESTTAAGGIAKIKLTGQR